MPLIYVDTLEDPRLDAFARLTEAQLRSKLEPERALFIAESQKVIERAFEGGMEPISLLMEEKWLPSMAPLIERMEERAGGRAGAPGMPVFVAPHDGQATHRLRADARRPGAFRRPALPTVADVLPSAAGGGAEDITNHQCGGHLPRSDLGGCRARQPRLLRPAVPPRRARLWAPFSKCREPYWRRERAKPFWMRHLEQ
ncbi:MAG: hypothetical protein ACLUE1_08150 [Adlercreutzia equolifaciens]